MTIQRVDLIDRTSIASITAKALRATITGATQANPCVITCSAGHALAAADKVAIFSVIGMVELNDNVYSVANPTATTFELSGINSTGFTAYTSGGDARFVMPSTIPAGRVYVFYDDASSKDQIADAIQRAKEKIVQLL